MSENKFTVLLVDDDEVDRRMVKKTFKKIGLNIPIVEARDGQKALDMLQNPAQYGLPEDVKSVLAIVDINMPNLDGISFLKKIKKDPQTKKMIVYILSTSSMEDDIGAAYDEYAAGYLVKGPTLESYISKIKFVKELTEQIEKPR